MEGCQTVVVDYQVRAEPIRRPPDLTHHPAYLVPDLFISSIWYNKFKLNLFMKFFISS